VGNVIWLRPGRSGRVCSPRRTSLRRRAVRVERVPSAYLIQEGFVQRTPCGRAAARRAYEHLKLPLPQKGPGGAGQGSLF
jgi:hypothetical protein